jgi:hypothetical protein
MDQHELGSRLTDWLCNNSSLVPFIRIDACIGESNAELYALRKASIEMRRQGIIHWLTRFSSEIVETALTCLIAPVPLPPPPLGAPSAAVSDWHLCNWTQYKLFRLRKRDLRSVLTRTKILMDLLRDPEVVPACVEITLNEREFARRMLDGSVHHFVLTEFLKVIHADYSLGCRRLLTIAGDQAASLARILVKLAGIADPQTFHFPITKEQDDFEMLLFSPAFPCAEEREGVLDGLGAWPRSEIPKRILELYVRMAHDFGIRNGVHASICIVLLFRVFFERAYVANPRLFYPNESMGLQVLSHSLMVPELEIGPEFLTEYDQSANVHEAFHGKEFFVECGRHLEAAVLYSNPFDAIYEISEMISCIERYAGRLYRGGILPFEVTFGFFIGIVLVSALPSFEELADFIADCSPMDGLCPSFEFATATMAGARRYCCTLRDRFSVTFCT